MTEYRITNPEPDKYYVERKGWFFWHRYQDYYYVGELDKKFSSYYAARQFLKTVMTHDKKHRDHEKRVWHFYE